MLEFFNVVEQSDQAGDLGVSTYSDYFDHTPRALLVWKGNPERQIQSISLSLDELHVLLELVQRAHARIEHRHTP